LDYFLRGVAVGLGSGSGITPGPLCVMMLKSAVRSGAVAGVCVAPAPLLTDAVIIALAVTVLEALPATALAIVGGTGRVPCSRLTCPSMPSARRGPATCLSWAPVERRYATR
jgi:hypothetical protein